MEWFKRVTPGLEAQTKKELPDGLWVKCEQCGQIIYKKDLERNYWVCSGCDYHFRIDSAQYAELLADEDSFEEFNAHLAPADPLNFKDSKHYADRLKDAIARTGMFDAVRTGECSVGGIRVVMAIMDFHFIGGSMGSVVGEKISRAIDQALKKRLPLIILSASGGARMQEGALSLMQMAKTSAKLTMLSDARLPYISILTDPTAGGTTASFSMLGDVIIAEPGSFIGFAGPRVIKQTIGQDLPEGFQRAEFVQEHGFVDLILHRRDLKDHLVRILEFFIGPVRSRKKKQSNRKPAPSAAAAPAQSEVEISTPILEVEAIKATPAAPRKRAAKPRAKAGAPHNKAAALADKAATPRAKAAKAAAKADEAVTPRTRAAGTNAKKAAPHAKAPATKGKAVRRTDLEQDSSNQRVKGENSTDQ